MKNIMKKPKSFHYGWLIVLSCFMVMSLFLCIIMNCPGLFLISVTEEFGITRSQYTLNMTVVSLATMLISLNAGRIFSKFKIRKVMIFGSIILPIAYGLYSQASNIYMFYAISIIVGLSMGLCGAVPVSTLLNNWFNDKKGLAMGIAFTGSGLGGLILQPLIGNLIATIGWRKTYIAIAILMFVLVVPCMIFIVKDHPSDIGLEPFGGIKKSENNEVIEEKGFTLSEATKKPYFWLYLPIVTISCASASSMIQNISPYVTDLGYDPTVAASLSALSLGILAVCKIILGQIYDKKGNLFGSVLSISCITIAALCYASAVNSTFLYIGLVISGLGIAFTTVGFPINTQTMFGNKDYSAIYGIVASFTSIGTAIGSPITSMIYDATGSYRIAWVMWGTLCLISALLFIVINKMSVKDKQ